MLPPTRQSEVCISQAQSERSAQSIANAVAFVFVRAVASKFPTKTPRPAVNISRKLCSVMRVVVVTSLLEGRRCFRVSSEVHACGDGQETVQVEPGACETVNLPAGR